MCFSGVLLYLFPSLPSLSDFFRPRRLEKRRGSGELGRSLGDWEKLGKGPGVQRITGLVVIVAPTHRSPLPELMQVTPATSRAIAINLPRPMSLQVRSSVQLQTCSSEGYQNPEPSTLNPKPETLKPKP